MGLFFFPWAYRYAFVPALRLPAFFTKLSRSITFSIYVDMSCIDIFYYYTRRISCVCFLGHSMCAVVQEIQPNMHSMPCTPIT